MDQLYTMLTHVEPLLIVRTGTLMVTKNRLVFELILDFSDLDQLTQHPNIFEVSKWAIEKNLSIGDINHSLKSLAMPRSTGEICHSVCRSASVQHRHCGVIKAVAVSQPRRNAQRVR